METKIKVLTDLSQEYHKELVTLKDNITKQKNYENKIKPRTESTCRDA
jgi:hypothetical protein